MPESRSTERTENRPRSRAIIFVAVAIQGMSILCPTVTRAGDADETKPPGGSARVESESDPATQAKVAPAGSSQSRAEVIALIDRVGRTPPDWFEATSLEYPKTLDLAWPEPSSGPWNAQKNVRQYIWDVINPNPAYRAGSLGYEAQVAVEVVVRDRRLASVRVTEHREKQFYSALSDTPTRLIAKQGVNGVDATSGATITSEAIINATAKALSGAVR